MIHPPRTLKAKMYRPAPSPRASPAPAVGRDRSVKATWRTTPVSAHRPSSSASRSGSRGTPARVAGATPSPHLHVITPLTAAREVVPQLILFPQPESAHTRSGVPFRARSPGTQVVLPLSSRTREDSCWERNRTSLRFRGGQGRNRITIVAQPRRTASHIRSRVTANLRATVISGACRGGRTSNFFRELVVEGLR